MTYSLNFDRVGKRFDQTVVLSDITFRTEPGEFVVLVGPSGCGKSTLLRLVAGLESISDGEIRAGDRVLNDVPPQERGVGMVFQSYALYPHMTVRENLAFPLNVKGASAQQQSQAVEEVSSILGLDPLLDRLPRQLSGGQRQRVAIGRCLVRKPDIYCFDEPLSNLDAALRAQIRVEIKALQRKLAKTTLYVTHDQVEAMTLADRIVVLNRGVVQQVGSPQQLYTKPANRFVARFIGTPSMSLARGKVKGETFTSGAMTVPLALSDEVPKGEVIVGVRAEDVRVLTEPGEGGSWCGDPSAFPATIRAVEPVGESGYLHLDVEGVVLEGNESKGKSDGDAGQLLLASVPGHAAFRYEVGGVVYIKLRRERCYAFHPETGDALAVQGGEG